MFDSVSRRAICVRNEVLYFTHWNWCTSTEWPFELLTCSIMSVTIHAVIKSPSQVPIAAIFIKVWFWIPRLWLVTYGAKCAPPRSKNSLYMKLIINRNISTVRNITIHDPWPSSENIRSLRTRQRRNLWMKYFPTNIPRPMANKYMKIFRATKPRSGGYLKRNDVKTLMRRNGACSDFKTAKFPKPRHWGDMPIIQVRASWLN